MDASLHTGTASTAESELLAEIAGGRRGLSRLRLPPLLESGFRRAWIEQSRTRIRVGMSAGVVLMLGFAVWDVASFPAEMARISVLLRTACASVLAWVVALTFLANDPDRLSRWLFPAGLQCGLTVVAVQTLGRLYHVPMSFEGLLLATLAIYSLSGMRTLPAIAAGLVTLLAFAASEAWTGQPGTAVVRGGIFLLATNLIGAADCFNREWSARRTFLVVRRLHELADRDGLTGLANRRHFDSHFERLWRQARREGHALAVALLDVDHFKAFNDRYGHLAGDECLRRIAGALGSTARRPFDLAARFGGEEFVIVWFDAEPDVAAQLADRALAAVEKLAIAHEASPVAGHVTASLGVAVVPPGCGATPVEILAAADEALYEAKAGGRARAVVRKL